MTIKELYEWAIINGYENFHIWGLTDKNKIDIYPNEEMIDINTTN